MNLDNYLNELCCDDGIQTRVVRVKDITARKRFVCYDIILIPHDVDEEGVTYRIESKVEDIRNRTTLYPSQFAVLGAWLLSDLINGAMYMEDSTNDYFKSEV